MKTLTYITAALVLSATAAQAGCGTNALNGTWRLQAVADSTFSDIVVLNGAVSGGGTIAQSKKNCRVTINFGALTATGRTENVAGTTKKPMLMTIYRSTDGLMAVLVRK